MKTWPLGALLLLTACTSTTPLYDAHFGLATRSLITEQIADPEAPEKHRDTRPDGMEARAATAVIERYYKSFAAPPPAGNVFNIGLSGAEGGAQK